MRPKYKVGDKVIVADLTDWEDDFGVGTNHEMRSMVGNIVTIKSAMENWSGDYMHYTIEEDRGCWTWLEDMFIAIRPCKFMTKH